MLVDPHYDSALRPLTGRDAPVVEYLRRDPEVARWLEDVRALLARWLPEIVRENRSSVTVAIGCTGGRPRPGYLVGQLAPGFRTDWDILGRPRRLLPAGDTQ